MRSNIKRKNYNLILVLIFVFNLVTQAALPAVAFATEVDSVTDDVTESIETVEADTEAINLDEIDEEEITTLSLEEEVVTTADEADASALELPIMHINDTHGNVQKLAFMVDEIDKYRAANDNAILLHAGMLLQVHYTLTNLEDKQI